MGETDARLRRGGVSDPAIRDAASLILWRRDAAGEAEVLMGQRGSAAAFMPSKYVFPGGAVDPADCVVQLADPLSPLCARRLSLLGQATPPTLAATAIRELWEETGLALGHPTATRFAAPADADEDWAAFAARGLHPSALGMTFLFRAITPPGRTRRFDARFFLAAADRVTGDTDDFSAASDELSHLHWIALRDTRRLDLPFITEVVLAEVAHFLRDGRPEAGVPFFDNSGPVPTFRRLA